VEQGCHPGHPGSAAIGPEAVEVDVTQVKRPDDLDDRVLVLTVVDVDPQEALRTELPDDVLGQLDGAVLAIGVEQPGGQAAQRTRPRMPAATTAISAVAYWRTSIVRSCAGSASHDSGSVAAGSSSIDGTSSVG
jgi:hypothetical protein